MLAVGAADPGYRRWREAEAEGRRYEEHPSRAGASAHLVVTQKLPWATSALRREHQAHARLEVNETWPHREGPRRPLHQGLLGRVPVPGLCYGAPPHPREGRDAAGVTTGQGGHAPELIYPRSSQVALRWPAGEGPS